MSPFLVWTGKAVPGWPICWLDCNANNKSICFTTHDSTASRPVANRVLLLRDGVIATDRRDPTAGQRPAQRLIA